MDARTLLLAYEANAAASTSISLCSSCCLENNFRKKIVWNKFNLKPSGLFDLPSLDVVSDPLLHVTVDARRELYSVEKHRIKLSFLLVVACSVVQHARVLRCRHRSKERMQITQVDRAEEDGVQEQPQTETANEEYCHAFLHAPGALVELQGDKGEDLRPHHANAEPKTSKVVPVVVDEES